MCFYIVFSNVFIVTYPSHTPSSRLSSCLCYFCPGVIKTVTEPNLGKKGFIWLTLPHCSPSLREVNAQTQTGTGTETIEECCLPTFCPGLLILLPLISQDHLLTENWALPHWLLTKRMHYRLAYNLVEAFSQLKFLLTFDYNLYWADKKI